MFGSGRKYFQCIDLHCGGEPARVLISGCPKVVYTIFLVALIFKNLKISGSWNDNGRKANHVYARF